MVRHDMKDYEVDVETMSRTSISEVTRVGKLHEGRKSPE